MFPVKCDCGADVPPENEQRVCAFQVEQDECAPDYKGAIFCDCCDNCRAECHAALIQCKTIEE